MDKIKITSIKKKLLALSMVGVILVCSSCEAPKIPLDNDGNPIPYTIPSRYCCLNKTIEDIEDYEEIDNTLVIKPKVLYKA